MSYGLAKTDNFLISAASLMIGTPANLFNLGAANAIGHVRNLKITADQAFVDIEQGTQGSIVMSVRNKNVVRGMCEVREYTAANIAWGLGLTGTSYAPMTVSNTTSAGVTGNGTVNTITLTSATGFVANDWIMIEASSGAEDDLIRRISSISTNTLTLNNSIPTGTNIASGAAVRKINAVPLADKGGQPPFLAAKILGQLPNGEKIGILLPKIRITKGFDMPFATNQEASLPFEFSVYDLVSTDTFAATFGTACGLVLRV